MRIAGRSDDVATILEAPRFPLAAWPTPVERFEPGLWVKRDDLSGFGRGGAKARKIEHVLGHLLAESRDELITVAGNVTNLAFDLLPAVDRAGLSCRLLIADDPPAPRPVREEIFAGIRDRIELIGPGRFEAAVRALGAFHEARRAGRRPFLLLPGASHPAAVLGNAAGWIELVEGLEEQGAPPLRTAFVTAATGNTLAGFLIGEEAMRGRGHPPVRIVGVQVYPGAVGRWTLGLIRWAERFARLSGRVPRDRIVIDDAALHGGFGRYPDTLVEECDRLKREAGLAVDPIFGGKTWQRMRIWRAAGRAAEPIVFWHCGYTPEWRSIGSALRRDEAA